MTSNRASIPSPSSGPFAAKPRFGGALPGRRLAQRWSLTSFRRSSDAAPPDWVLVGSVLALVFIGLIFVFSSSLAVSQELQGSTHYYAVRQLIGAGIGLGAFVLLARIDYRFWQRISAQVVLLALLLLGAVLIPGIGHEENGAQRWIQVGSLPALQPSEFAKLAICVYVAGWLAAKGTEIQKLSLGLVPLSLIIGAVGGLLMLEPDLGTFVTIASMAVILFFLAGAAMRHMLLIVLGGSAALFSIIVIAGYGMERIRTFFNAEDVAQAAGFQIINLVSTLGSGGLTGVGLGASRQKFFYVPSAHTDGVFAIIGEETGMLGALIVLTIFGVLIWRGIRAGMRAEDRFGALLAYGIVAWFGLQAFFNVAGVMRAIVLTGIPLPFLSFGSSALISSLAAAGILVSISRFGRKKAPPESAPPLVDSGAPRDTARHKVNAPVPRGSFWHRGRGSTE